MTSYDIRAIVPLILETRTANPRIKDFIIHAALNPRQHFVDYTRIPNYTTNIADAIKAVPSDLSIHFGNNIHRRDWYASISSRDTDGDELEWSGTKVHWNAEYAILLAAIEAHALKNEMTEEKPAA